MQNKYSPFCEKQARYIKRSLTSWLNIAEGGKRAGKNVMNITAWAACLENHPDKLHLAAGVSISAAKLNILDSNGYGLLNYFRGRCHEGQYEDRDALYIQTRTGEKIVLIAGGRDKGSEAKIKGNTYGTVYITEANECAEDFVKECMTRTLTSHDRKIFMDLNPKPPQHWFYVDFLNFYEKQSAAGLLQGYNYEHFTVLDNLSITMKMLRELLMTYDKKSFWYASDILGLRTAPNGIVYDSWTSDNLYDGRGMADNWRDMCQRIIAIDYGTNNPLAMLDMYDDGTTYWVDREYYYDSRRERKQKTDRQYGDDFEAFVDHDLSVQVVLDPSASSFATELRNRGYSVREANNDVKNGIRVVSNLMQRCYVRVRVDACPNLVREISGYVWDEKATMRGEEAPLKENDHAVDALRYGIFTTAGRWRLAM